MPFQRMPDALFSRALAEMRRDGGASQCANRLPRPAFPITLLASQQSTASDRRGHRYVWSRIVRATPASNVTAQFTGQ